MFTDARTQTIARIWLQMTLGFFMFYAGLSKIIDPAWSAKGYLLSAKTFPGLYAALAAPTVLPVINVINEWALLLLGVSLLTGLFLRLSAPLGMLLMLLYYFPTLSFPNVPNGFIIDEHMIFIAVLFWLAASSHPLRDDWSQLLHPFKKSVN